MDRYRTVRQIGAGSFGRVELVQERGGGARRLVLKVVDIQRMGAKEQEKVGAGGTECGGVGEGCAGDARGDAAVRAAASQHCPLHRVLHRGRLRQYGQNSGN